MSRLSRRCRSGWRSIPTERRRCRAGPRGRPGCRINPGNHRIGRVRDRPCPRRRLDGQAADVVTDDVPTRGRARRICRCRSDLPMRPHRPTRAPGRWRPRARPRRRGEPGPVGRCSAPLGHIARV